jgi:pimeloyl-ACP methyl ester carboxylesterase
MRAEFTSLGGEFGELRLHRTEWGDPASPRAVVCVHGLTRNARDFDALARALSERARVICVDAAGATGWLIPPSTGSTSTRATSCACWSWRACAASTGSAPRWAA